MVMGRLHFGDGAQSIGKRKTKQGRLRKGGSRRIWKIARLEIHYEMRKFATLLSLIFHDPKLQLLEDLPQFA
jgi:hypothetical protein